MNVQEFVNRMIAYFPETETEIKEFTDKNEKMLLTIVMEDIIMPRVIKLVMRGEDIEKINQVFALFEEISMCEDNNLRDFISVTVLEIFGNEEELLKMASKYMGIATLKLQKEADLDLGRHC